jgi:hypothetical protein
MFDPAPLSPQALRPAADTSSLPAGPVRYPTLMDGVMMYPDAGPQPEAIDGFEKTDEHVFESFMTPCRHRYEVMALDPAGVTTVKHTCLHTLSGHTNQYVTQSVCDGCPWRKGHEAK